MEQRNAARRLLLLHVVLSLEVKQNIAVSVKHYNLVPAVLRKTCLDGDPLVVRQEKWRRLSLIVVPLRKEVESGTVGLLHIQHKGAFQQKDMAGFLSLGGSGLVAVVP